MLHVHLGPTRAGGSCFDTLKCCLQHMVCVVYGPYIQHAEWDVERHVVCVELVS